MTVFISYARKDHELVDVLVRDVVRARQHVWLDRDLTGGQDWWDTVLAQIRSCRLFIFVLSAASLRSRACLAELRYASDLGRPILPVMVSDVALQLVPQIIARTQIVDYRRRDADAAVDLTNALAMADTESPLPDPLPEPPAVPASYESALREEIGAKSLTFQQQRLILTELTARLNDAEDLGVVRELMRDLRRRSDITELVAREIDDLLASQPMTVDDVSAAGRRPEFEVGRAPGATQAADLPNVSASDRANEQSRTVSGAKRRAPDSDTPETAVEGGKSVFRWPRLTRPIVLVPVLGAVALLAIGAAVAFSRSGGDELDDLDVGSVESNFERVIDESTFESEIPPDQCPLGDLTSMASDIDNAVPMSISITGAQTFVEVDPDPADGPPFIICGDEPLAVQLFASGVIGAETAKSELTALGAEEAGGHRNGQIVEWNQQDEEESCASYWLSEDVNIIFGVILGGDECSTEASTLALTAVLPEMVRSLSSFTFTPSETTTPASVTTASAP
jgi:hypothetical protein